MPAFTSAYTSRFSSDATQISAGFIFVHQWSHCTKICHYSVSWCSGRKLHFRKIFY
jgi:hypothetical protein